MVGQVGFEPTIVKLADLQSATLATRRLTHMEMLIILVGQVGFEPTTALSTGFTVRGDTNYTVLTHIVVFIFVVGQVGLEPTIVKPTDLQSAALAARRLAHIVRESPPCIKLLLPGYHQYAH